MQYFYIFIYSGLFNDMSSSEYTTSICKLVNNGLEMMWKKAVIAQFEIPYQHLLGGTVETMKNLSQYS
jgi:hypothetical protein